MLIVETLIDERGVTVMVVVAMLLGGEGGPMVVIVATEW